MSKWYIMLLFRKTIYCLANSWGKVLFSQKCGRLQSGMYHYGSGNKLSTLNFNKPLSSVPAFSSAIYLHATCYFSWTSKVNLVPLIVQHYRLNLLKIVKCIFQIQSKLAATMLSIYHSFERNPVHHHKNVLNGNIMISVSTNFPVLLVAISEKLSIISYCIWIGIIWCARFVWNLYHANFQHKILRYFNGHQFCYTSIKWFMLRCNKLPWAKKFFSSVYWNMNG